MTRAFLVAPRKFRSRFCPGIAQERAKTLQKAWSETVRKDLDKLFLRTYVDLHLTKRNAASPRSRQRNLLVNYMGLSRLFFLQSWRTDHSNSATLLKGAAKMNPGASRNRSTQPRESCTPVSGDFGWVFSSKNYVGPAKPARNFEVFSVEKS